MAHGGNAKPEDYPGFQRRRELPQREHKQNVGHGLGAEIRQRLDKKVAFFIPSQAGENMMDGILSH